LYVGNVRLAHYSWRTLLVGQDSLEKLTDTLGVHVDVDLELTIGAFYKTCDEQWLDDGVFWTEIYNQEHEHADNIKKLPAMISCSPDKFMLGRHCNHVAINTIISGIRKNIEFVKANALSKIKA
jgi:hypothetical protein